MAINCAQSLLRNNSYFFFEHILQSFIWVANTTTADAPTNKYTRFSSPGTTPVSICTTLNPNAVNPQLRAPTITKVNVTMCKVFAFKKFTSFLISPSLSVEKNIENSQGARLQKFFLKRLVFMISFI